jgi:hypothetical protein
MIKLLFVPEQFPRTIGRDEWKEIWRWKRVTERELTKAAEQQRNDFITYGSTWPTAVRERIINEMINPPVVIHDKQDFFK